MGDIQVPPSTTTTTTTITTTTFTSMSGDLSEPSVHKQQVVQSASKTTDLRSTKTELFNKLITSQQQQQLDSSSIEPENLNLNLVSRNNKACQASEALKMTTTSGENGQAKVQSSKEAASGCNQSKPVESTLFSRIRSRWYTNDEVASILTSFALHPEWQTNELQMRPKSGAVLLYSREKVRYRQDGYCWKKRKNGRTTREDHMKLKVQGIECIYGCYVHSAILPTFHRRCYWLLENPDIVLVHYLNQPPDDQNKMMLTFNSSMLEEETRRSWTNEEIIEEIGSVFGGISHIHHTLNINFPPNASVVTQVPLNQGEQLQSSENLERMIEMSPTSTSNSEAAINEQVDMTIVDQQQQQQQNSITATEPVHQQHHRHQQQQLLLQQQTMVENNCRLVGDEDEMMTTISQDDIINNNARLVEQTNTSGSNLVGPDCDVSSQHQHHHLRLHQINGHDHEDAMSMTFDLVSNPSHICFDYGQSGINSNNVAIETSDENKVSAINNHVTTNKDIQTTSGGRMEQNPCSPVTQIYNKIVDDIETYALPLEPNQFNSNHHHHHHHHHHSLAISSMPVQSMEVERQHLDQHHHGHNQQQQQQEQPQHSTNNSHLHQLDQQFTSDNRHQSELSRANNHDTHKGHHHHHHQTRTTSVDCPSMDLANCDLFGHGLEQADPSGQVESNESVGQDNDDNLLLSDFNLPTAVHSNDDQLNTGVVDSLAHEDCDLRDLIMGISPSNCNMDQSNLLVDNNSLDLFNFKQTDYDVNRPQQFDVKSTTSDTDALNRLSPLIAPVPRCNSTGNAMQPALIQQTSNNTQHLSSSNFQVDSSSANQSGQHSVNGRQKFFNEHQRSNQLCSQRSLSTNPSTSTTSYSPSPSLTSLKTAGNPSSANRSSACAESDQYTSSTSNSLHSHSFIKLPLHQRQNSEQQEPSNNILNTLLPKALSLDGSNQQYHRVSVSPLIPFESSSQQQDDSLLIPLSIGQPQQQHQPVVTMADQYRPQQRFAGASPVAAPTATIPMENSSEILVNSLDNFNTALNAYNMGTTTQQQQQHQPQAQTTSSDCKPNTGCLLHILDYVPNWCNIMGGAKVLIVGNWSSLLNNDTLNCGNQQQQQQHINITSIDKDQNCSTFYAIFDDLLVPATLIQDNVLRCYVPSHEPGFITLKVLYKNRIVSDQVLFEMRPSCVQNVEQVAMLNSNYSGNNNKELPNEPSISNIHRNSTSSNQSSTTTNSNSNNITVHNQKSQVSPSNNVNNAATDSSKVLTLAENIISAMHRKNISTSALNAAANLTTSLAAAAANSKSKSPVSRLANSLDIESLDRERSYHLHHQRHFSLKGVQRRLAGSRSLSRDSELNSNFATVNYGFMTDKEDPYWHQGSSFLGQGMMQPLSVVTDIATVNQQTLGGPNLAQKRHSSDSSSFSASFQLHQTAQASGNMPFVQRPMHFNHHIPLDTQNLTETSSSGLGSIVSSLSPSNSSLHSPSSVVRDSSVSGGGAGGVGGENQSPTCSCGRQSSGTPTSADFCEYFQASAKTEESFASLTLNDHEQQELYEAAKVIQKAYRTYRGRKRQASELLVELTGDDDGGSSGGRLAELAMVEQYDTGGGQQKLMGGSGSSLVLNSTDSGQANPLMAESQQLRCYSYVSPMQQQQMHGQPICVQQATTTSLVKCYQDREMQAATIIQAYYRRYRQYVHYKRQQQRHSNTIRPHSSGTSCLPQAADQLQLQRSPGARLVVDTMPMVIDKATTSHVDRKRFKTAILISGCGADSGSGSGNGAGPSSSSNVRC